MTTTAHHTIVFERSFACPVAMLYQAFVDPVARARWGVPSPTAVIIYEAADFRIGGTDRSRCGTNFHPRFLVEVTYLDIVPESRIVHTETVSTDGKRLSAALETIEMAADGNRSKLKVTMQIAAFDGADMADGVRQGFGAALDNLARELGV